MTTDSDTELLQDEEASFKPNWSVSPSEILREILADRGLTQTAFAAKCGRPVRTINSMLNGRIRITEDSAYDFERALGIDRSFFLNLQRMHDEYLKRSGESLPKKALRCPLCSRVIRSVRGVYRRNAVFFDARTDTMICVDCLSICKRLWDGYEIGLYVVPERETV